MTRTRLGVAAAVAALGLLAWFSMGGAQQRAKTEPATAAKQAPAADPKAPARPQGSAPTGGGLTAFKDPETGELRAPLPGEAEALIGPSSAEIAGPLQQLAAPGGGVGIVLPDSFTTYEVATKGPDGKITVQHAAGQAAAEEILKASPKREVQDEK